MNQSFNNISSEELCKRLSIKDVRSLLTTNGFPKPLFDEQKIMFNKQEVSKYFNVENIDEPFITSKEAAKYVNIGVGHLKSLATNNKVPSYRIKSVKGSCFLFRKSELDILKKIDIEGNVEFINHFIGNEVINFVFRNYIDLFKNKLTIREYEVVFEYFFNKKTFLHISKQFKITPLRVRQIFNKANRRLMSYLTTSKMLEADKLVKIIHKQNIEINHLKSLMSNDNNEVYSNNEEVLSLSINFLSEEINSFELSARVFNILKNYDICTVGELLFEYGSFSNNINRLFAFRGFGRNSFIELKDYMEIKENEFTKITKINAEEFFSNNPKTPNNLSLFNEIKKNLRR